MVAGCGWRPARPPAPCRPVRRPPSATACQATCCRVRASPAASTALLSQDRAARLLPPISVQRLRCLPCRAAGRAPRPRAGGDLLPGEGWGETDGAVRGVGARGVLPHYDVITPHHAKGAARHRASAAVGPYRSGSRQASMTSSMPMTTTAVAQRRRGGGGRPVAVAAALSFWRETPATTPRTNHGDGHAAEATDARRGLDSTRGRTQGDRVQLVIKLTAVWPHRSRHSAA